MESFGHDGSLAPRLALTPDAVRAAPDFTKLPTGPSRNYISAIYHDTNCGELSTAEPPDVVLVLYRS